MKELQELLDELNDPDLDFEGLKSKYEDVCKMLMAVCSCIDECCHIKEITDINKMLESLTQIK